MDDGRAVDKFVIFVKLREQVSSGEEGENVSGDDVFVEDNSVYGSFLGDVTSNSGEQDEYADESYVFTMRECKVMVTRIVIRMCE